jgi:osmoprotectant transport system permease protein
MKTWWILLLIATTPALAGSQPVPAPRKVVVGSKNFTESVILGEIVVQQVRGAGFQAEHRKELGGTEFVWRALRAGEVDVYPEYIGTIVREILHEKGVRYEDEIRNALAEQGIRMSHGLGFSNSYALGMKEERARELRIRAISDLRDRPGLRFRFCDEFLERRDGWPGLRKFYGLPQQDVGCIDHSAAYLGLQGGALDGMDVYTTDAEISHHNVRVLRDDLGYFPVYQAVLVYRADLVQRAPNVVAALRKLENQITQDVMVELNHRVRIDGHSERRVAAELVRVKFDPDVEVPQESVLETLRRHVTQFGRNTGEHLYLVAVSLVAAMALAIPLGVTASRRPKAGQVILGVVGVIQTLPSLALLVLLIPLFGLGPWPAIIALFLYSLLPIVQNTYAGLQSIPPEASEAAKALGLPSAARLCRVELPMASRSILAGVRTAAVINVGVATIGALIGAGGYGQPILTGIRLNDALLILRGAIPAALLALAVHALFSVAERFIIPKGLQRPVESSWISEWPSLA